MKNKSENTTHWLLSFLQTARLCHCSHGQATAGVLRFCKEENQFLSVSFPILGSSPPINQNSLLFGQLGGPGLTWGNTVALSVSQAVGCPSQDSFLHGKAQRHSWKTGTINQRLAAQGHKNSGSGYHRAEGMAVPNKVIVSKKCQNAGILKTQAGPGPGPGLQSLSLGRDVKGGRRY